MAAVLTRAAFGANLFARTVEQCGRPRPIDTARTTSIIGFHPYKNGAAAICTIMYITSTVERRRRRLVALAKTRASTTDTAKSIGSSTGSRVTHRSQTPPRISLHDAFSSSRSMHGRHLRQLKRRVPPHSPNDEIPKVKYPS